MPRRPSPDRCQFCRRRKKKCDGQHPCFACSKAKIECVYAIPPAPASSDFLGQKSAQNSLKPRPKAKKTSETLRKGDGTHGSFEAAPETALSHRGSLPANDSRPGSRPSIELATRSKEPNPRLPVVVDSSAASQQSVSTSDADDLSDHSASAAASAAVSPPRPPPPPPLPYASPHIDWPQARVLRVLDNILQWDCVALCLVDRERFRWGLLHAGPGPSPGRPGSAAAATTALCTPALVDALLALSVAVFRHNVVDEVANRATGKPAWDVLSAALADEAVRALHRGPAWPPESLPDVQALGVLALYCACRGWRDETRNFAMDFSEAIRKYCVRTAPRPGLAVVPPAATRRITASTYCGAISMNRMLIQIQRCRPGLPSTRTENTNPSDRCDNQSWTEHLLRPIIAHELVVATSELRGDEMYLVAAELYQLVEQVFRTCCVPEQDRTFAEATATYIQGLEWYQNFFKYSEDYTGREPLILFVHTYYHFCILSLFTPYMMDETVVGNGGSPPGKICEEAANSILKLMRHHESLAGDTEAVGFMQSFKSASLEFLDVYKQTS